MTRRNPSRLTLGALVVVAAGLFTAQSQATIISINTATALSFQDEGTTNVDQTALMTALDGSWAPAPVGTVTQSYYATGTSPAYFDAISANFDLSTVGFGNITGAALRFFLQKGDYATVDGSRAFDSGRNAWEHYQVLQGASNPTNQDQTPFSAPGAIDFFSGGTAARNQTLGWMEVALNPAWISSNSFDVTLRLWNARIDKIELSVTSVPEPSTLAALLLGLLGLVWVRRGQLGYAGRSVAVKARWIP